MTQPVGPEIGTAAHRVVVEALTNVRRHAVRATRVSVDLTTPEEHLVVSVADDGQGGEQRLSATPSSGEGGLGLAAMSDRVQRLGGTVEAGPHGRRGWRVTVRLPLGRDQQGAPA